VSREILRGILCGMLCGILRGMLCGILRGRQWDGLYGEDVVYKSAGDPSCLVFSIIIIIIEYHHHFLSSLFA